MTASPLKAIDSIFAGTWNVCALTSTFSDRRLRGMLKIFRRSEIALGFLLGALFWIPVLGWQASYLPTERQKEECYEAAKKAGNEQDECKSFWEKVTSDPIAMFNLILAFSTVGLWVATISMSRAGNNQIKLAREEFIATHRPKIRIHAVEIKHREVDDKVFIGASILAFNVGESVAKNVEVRGQIFMGPRFALDVQRPIVKAFPEVLSGQKLRADIDSDCQVSTAVAGRRNGIICYYLGWIAYWDEAGNRRETGFCLQPESGANGGRWVSANQPEHEYEY
jgi:hypothetical protein